MARIMERFSVGPASLADRLGVDVALVERLPPSRDGRPS